MVKKLLFMQDQHMGINRGIGIAVWPAGCEFKSHVRFSAAMRFASQVCCFESFKWIHCKWTKWNDLPKARVEYEATFNARERAGNEWLFTPVCGSQHDIYLTLPLSVGGRRERVINETALPLFCEHTWFNYATFDYLFIYLLFELMWECICWVLKNIQI